MKLPWWDKCPYKKRKRCSSTSSSINPPLTSPPYWYPGFPPHCELKAMHVCTVPWLLHHTWAYYGKQLVNGYIWFMTTLDNQFSFLFTFVLLPSPIDSKMHNFSFLTSLKLPQNLWHLRFDDVWHFTFHMYVFIPKQTASSFIKGLTHCIFIFLHLSGKDPVDSIDPPYILAKRGNCFLNCSFSPEKGWDKQRAARDLDMLDSEGA